MECRDVLKYGMRGGKDKATRSLSWRFLALPVNTQSCTPTFLQVCWRNPDARANGLAFNAWSVGTEICILLFF